MEDVKIMVAKKIEIEVFGGTSCESFIARNVWYCDCTINRTFDIGNTSIGN